MPPVSFSIPDFSGLLLDGGHYEVVSLIGSGAFGAVYLALDLEAASSSKACHPVQRAIKILQKAGSMKADTTHQRREISLHHLASSHRNIVTMYDAFEDSKFFYLVLDYCPGGDLFNQVCEKKIFARNDALLKKVYLQILDAVQACHQKKVFHRDLKPENILCNTDGSAVYLADFGLATSRAISYTFGCGSSFYMSPECIGEDLGYSSYSTRHSDIWALGIILINMITGRNPWEFAKTEDSSFSDFLIGDTYFTDTLPISKGANAIIRGILAVNPLARPEISQIREAILNLDTFFLTAEEIAQANETVRSVASDAYALQDENDNSVLKDDLFGEEGDNDPVLEDIDLGTVDLDECYFLADSTSNPPTRSKSLLHVMSVDRAFEIPLPSSRSPSRCTATLSKADSVSDIDCPDWSSTCTSSSGYDSAGPTTPGVYAQDPSLEIPDVLDGDLLGEALLPYATPKPDGKEVFESPSPAMGLLQRLELISIV